MSEISALCAPFEADLSALLDEQLDSDRAGEMRAHLASCADCERRLETLREVDGALQRIAATPVTATRAARMRAAIARAKPVHRAPPRRRWLAPAAVAAAAAAAALVLSLREPPSAAPGVDATAVAALAPPTSRADAEAAAREMSAKIDTPIGASAAPSPADRVDGAGDPALEALGDLALVEQLDLFETLGASAAHAEQVAPAEPMSDPQHSALREQIARLILAKPADGARLGANLARWEQLSAAERDRLRARWYRFQELPAAERERLLHERGAKDGAAR